MSIFRKSKPGCSRGSVAICGTLFLVIFQFFWHQNEAIFRVYVPLFGVHFSKNDHMLFTRVSSDLWDIFFGYFSVFLASKSSHFASVCFICCVLFLMKNEKDRKFSSDFKEVCMPQKSQLSFVIFENLGARKMGGPAGRQIYILT